MYDFILILQFQTCLVLSSLVQADIKGIVREGLLSVMMKKYLLLHNIPILKLTRLQKSYPIYDLNG